MKFVLIMYSKDNTKDRFEFDDSVSLYRFIIDYIAESLDDSNFVEMEYDIKVED